METPMDRWSEAWVWKTQEAKKGEEGGGLRALAGLRRYQPEGLGSLPSLFPGSCCLCLLGLTTLSRKLYASLSPRLWSHLSGMG